MKKEQSYTNDYYVHHIEEWFEHHDNLSKEQYIMLKTMVRYMREKKKTKDLNTS